MQRLKNTLTFSYLDRKHYIFNKFHLNRETFDEEQIQRGGSKQESKANEIISLFLIPQLLDFVIRTKNPLSQRKIIEQGNQFVLLVFDSFCHSGVKLIPLYFTNRICHSGARHYRLMDFPELSSSIFPKFSPWDLKLKQQLRRLFLTIQCTAVGHYPPPENALIKYPLFLLKLFSLAIFLPSFQSI